MGSFSKRSFYFGVTTNEVTQSPNKELLYLAWEDKGGNAKKAYFLKMMFNKKVEKNNVFPLTFTSILSPQDNTEGKRYKLRVNNDWFTELEKYCWDGILHPDP